MEGSKTMVIQPLKQRRDTRRIENFLTEDILHIPAHILREYL
jgi:hypothetical protein